MVNIYDSYSQYPKEDIMYTIYVDNKDMLEDGTYCSTTIYEVKIENRDGDTSALVLEIYFMLCNVHSDKSVYIVRF